MAALLSSHSYFLRSLLFFLFSLCYEITLGFPHGHGHGHGHEWAHHLARNTCENVAVHPFDYSAKERPGLDQPMCLLSSNEVTVAEAPSLPDGSFVIQADDYSCSETKPCSNGACCPKETGWCNYGPEACGTSGTSPNEVCWSNCDAKAECGRFADPPGKECPLNVCCSSFGFCGMTEEFCKVTDDEEESCQSNCEQPGSGGSDTNVRERVVGYYEAWVHERACNGMSIEQIPVGALTHLMFSFAYITPDDFQIVPMDDLDPELFSKMARLKEKNKALKVMVALGGWTFNDPGPTQTVFHDLASTKANRAKFIGNLMSFMRQYAYDGVDFDWEYPGAEDRGGKEEDGENFTLLLEELRDAIREQPLEYVVSFTTPTSYWYLRHFDIKASTDAVDFVNIMSYDLHGIWDAWNPIGSNVMAHTNLTEIDLALDLYWRNDIPAHKLNLGIGFYGRSFQLSDPACYKPGCQFLGGASPGPCTKSSGTLAYREIMDIIEENNLEPYYDEDHQVKYIHWNQDQWVSYDDEETIRVKLDFASERGLGGLLIWSVDQDTDDLSALSAVVGPQVIALAMKSTVSDDASYWQDIGNQGCYVTDCGGHCDVGYKTIETQPCGDAHWFTRHSSEADSRICCPLSASPDPDDCRWRSKDPWCTGRCEPGEVGLAKNKWGDGKYCETGHKMYCCTASLAQDQCYWNDDWDRGEDAHCNGNDVAITFAGSVDGGNDEAYEFLRGLRGDDLVDALSAVDPADISLYCCPSEEAKRWDSCEWKGDPNDCGNAHCDLNTEVSLTWAGAGGGETCGIHFDRVRVYCCDPPAGENLFLPVPLEDLFPNPPSEDDADTSFDLNVDNTWGDGDEDTAVDDDPNAAAFQFHVLASPDEIQTSLDRRDGSDWEVFNCGGDSLLESSEEAQTVQMVCATEGLEASNCGNLFKGHGAVGTIVQMPRGCGPGKYAVVKSLEPSRNQTLPRHLARRSFALSGRETTVHDLTFDYDFARVPRDFGDTQLRIDFSNQEGYWDTIVEAPSSKKRKRSLSDFKGNHRRWLEHEWRDDYHFGAVDRRELHRRWFGEDVIDWLKSLLDVDIKVEKRHEYHEEVSATILQEEWNCGPFKAKIDAIATAGITMSTSFGITIITTLGPDMDLSQSFLHFNNEGSIEAIFTLDAVAKVDWDSGVFTIVPLPIPGATFRIPGIVTLGPRFDLNARFKAGLSIDGRVEAKASIANWEIRQTYPQQDSYEPKQIDSANRQFPKSNLATPDFDASVTANGYAEAHILPTLAFGLKFDKSWEIDDADVELVADLYGRVRAKSDLVGGDCLFGYKVEAGVKLVADAHIPDVFGWNPSPYTFGQLDKRIIPESDDDSEWECVTGEASRMMGAAATLPFASSSSVDSMAAANSSSPHKLIGTGLRKRLIPYESAKMALPTSEKLCPTKGDPEPAGECDAILAVPSFYDSVSEDQAYNQPVPVPVSGSSSVSAASFLEKRNKGKDVSICKGKIVNPVTDKLVSVKSHSFHIKDWDTVSVYEAQGKSYPYYDNERWADCNNFNFGEQPGQQELAKKNNPRENEGYVVEHILEANMLSVFLQRYSDLCFEMAEANSGWYARDVMPPIVDGAPRRDPWQYIADAYPHGSGSEGRRWPYPAEHEDEFLAVIEPVNTAKEFAFKFKEQLPWSKDMREYATDEAQVDRAIRLLKIMLMTYKYLNEDTVRNTLVTQAQRVRDRMSEAENVLSESNQYTSQIQGMGELWMTFVKGQTDVAAQKLITFMTHWMPEIEKALQGTVESEDDEERATKREKIRSLRQAIDNRPGWRSPFGFW